MAKNAKMIGLDCGSHGVKVVVYRNNSITESLWFETPIGAVKEGVIKDLNPLVDLLAPAIAECGLQGFPVAIAADSQAAMVNMQEIQGNRNSQDLRQILRIPEQVELFFPSITNPSAYVYDWKIIGYDAESNQTRVVVAAAPTEMVTQYRNLCRQLGLRLSIIDAQQALLADLLPEEASGTGTLIAMFGAEAFTALLYDHQGYPSGVRIDALLGGNELSYDLQRDTNLSFAESEEMKKQLSARDGHPLVSQWIDRLSDLMSQMMRYYSSKHVDDIERIVLVGGGANLPDLPSVLEERLGVACEIATLDGLKPPLPEDTNNPLAMIPALLALRRGVMFA